MHIDFTGSRVVVTGASRGIGLSVAHRFATAGAEVVMLAEHEAIEAVAEEVAAATGAQTQAVVCDIADREAVRRELGKLSDIAVLVNNAAIERFTPILSPEAEVEENFVRTVQVNLIGQYFVTRELAPRIKEGGRIIFTSSVWGKTAVASHAAYCGTKHGILGMMRSLSRELGKRRITVNAVCPGWTETDMAMSNLDQMAELEGKSPEALLEGLLDVQSIKGLMKPDEVSGIYVFLASEFAASITGQAINVDRGELIC